jgi:hypothetical protein
MYTAVGWSGFWTLLVVYAIYGYLLVLGLSIDMIANCHARKRRHTN